MDYNRPRVSASTNKPTENREGKPAFRIRAGRRGDVEAISALLTELGYSQGADMATVHWVISHPETETLIAADSADRPIGMLTLSHRPQLRLRGRIVTIDELVVQSNWRRKGVGRELVRRAIERSRVLSARMLELLAPMSDPGAMQFCQQMGFTEAGESQVMRLGALERR
jgi:GNAT superfamily N-acetyltransferase